MIKALILGLGILSCNHQTSKTILKTTEPVKEEAVVKTEAKEMNSIYDFKVQGLTGDSINFKDFKGKKIMIVNTASHCGNTPQYAGLETLYEKYKSKLTIIGFPANNFGAQEPGSNEEIVEFCKKNYGVSFPMAAKISVKGDDIHPLYKYLVAEAEKIGVTDPVKWNFTKFLLDENGKLIAVIHNKVDPASAEVTSKL